MSRSRKRATKLERSSIAGPYREPKKLHPTRAADLRGYHTVACGEGGMQRDEPAAEPICHSLDNTSQRPHAGSWCLFATLAPDQIDGLHIDSDLMLIAALIDGEGRVLYYARRLAPTVEDGL